MSAKPLKSHVESLRMLIQVHAKVSLGRNFGFVALNPPWWNAAIYVICDALQIPRILAEERLLSEDAGYR